MYLLAFTHTRTHTHTHTHIHTHTHTHTYTHNLSHTYTNTHTLPHTHKHAHIHTQTHTLSHTHTHAYTHEHLHACMYLCTYKHIPQIRNVCLNMHAYSHKRSHNHTHPSHAPTPAQLLPLYLMRLVPPANACAGETLITLPASATPFPSISSHPATLHKPSRRQVLRRAIQVSPSHLQVCVAWCSARWT